MSQDVVPFGLGDDSDDDDPGESASLYSKNSASVAAAWAKDCGLCEEGPSALIRSRRLFANRHTVVVLVSSGGVSVL